MSEAKDKWDDVGTQFADIGRKMKERYEANATMAEADKQRVHDALSDIGDALDAGFTALGDSLRDTSMRDDLKTAGVAVADALAATFNDVATEIKKAVRK